MEPTIRQKYRVVKSYGKIRLCRQRNKYTFQADPFKHSPVLSMEDRSQWKIVNTVYDLIKELKD
jgi:hypothetical protein